jgi:dTDP-4-amino-4,6-dideoxygalactose transaminase
MCDMDAISQIAKSRGLFVLEDADKRTARSTRAAAPDRLATPGRSRSAPARTWARSETGAPSAPTTICSPRLRRVRNLGQRVKGEHVELGFNERLDGLQAALLRVKLPHLDTWTVARRTRARAEMALRVRSVVHDQDNVWRVTPQSFQERDE